ncbi:Ctr-domain-containing protein [Guyanagaster necrorhizus]|uniref:Copper transport protein n=1 Tax=Guyanagaster necrorhizus TaxID=856835 RepID=A0A9P8ASP9_9AGAR|nr:Ctr-domain-containing protein [Guyanagaster necrorhizus MCA 3950]KAG7446643.1 Ctr-domain-containing protein [Guyanagaster necrorhizus MCA 3950]
MDHGDYSEGMALPRCSMNMLWNTQIEHTCIVFRSWHITTTTQFVLSCLAIVALGLFYEYLRAFQKTVDARIAASLSKDKRSRRSRSSSRASDFAEDSLLLSGRVLAKPLTGVAVPPLYRALRATLYGVTVFLSFFLMLVFMTYNVRCLLSPSFLTSSTLGIPYRCRRLGSCYRPLCFRRRIEPRLIRRGQGNGVSLIYDPFTCMNYKYLLSNAAYDLVHPCFCISSMQNHSKHNLECAERIDYNVPSPSSLLTDLGS